MAVIRVWSCVILILQVTVITVCILMNENLSKIKDVWLSTSAVMQRSKGMTFDAMCAAVFRENRISNHHFNFDLFKRSKIKEVWLSTSAAMQKNKERPWCSCWIFILLEKRRWYDTDIFLFDPNKYTKKLKENGNQEYNNEHGIYMITWYADV